MMLSIFLLKMILGVYIQTLSGLTAADIRVCIAIVLHIDRAAIQPQLIVVTGQRVWLRISSIYRSPFISSSEKGIFWIE